MPVVEKPRMPVNTSGARNAPFIDLEDAIGKARILYQKARRSPVHLSVFANYLNYSPKASSLTLIVSALKKYGLAVDEGSAEGRRLKLSDLGYDIIADTLPASPGREAKIREAALLPKAHRDLWEQFGAPVPDDNTLEVFLKLSRGYTEEAARNAVRVYRATIIFAHLDQEGILGDVSADEADRDAAVPGGPAGTRAAMDRTNSAPEWAAPAGSPPARTLSIPLKGSRTFDIRFPSDLSKDDFDFIVANIRLWERQIIAPAE